MKSALFVYIGVGNGFKAPAVSIGNEIQKKGIEVIYNDFYLDLGVTACDKFIKVGWQLMVKIPMLFRFVLGISNFSIHKKINNAIFFFFGGYHKIKNHLKKINPDFIFISDFLSLHAYLAVIQKEKLNIPVFYYNSDVVFGHALFVNNHVARAFVSTKEGYQGMIKKGVQKHLLSLTSFPINVKYKKKFLSIAEQRKKLQIKNKFTILFSAGGEGIADLSWIDSLLQSELDLQIIVICGKSKATLQKIQMIQKKYPQKDIVAKGFVNNMQDYLYCCDINSGKAGMNIIFESIFMKKPFLSLMAMANEMHVEKYLIEKGGGWRVRSSKEILSLIENLLKDKNLIQQKIAKMQEIKVDFHTEKIADEMLEEVKKQKTKI